MKKPSPSKTETIFVCLVQIDRIHEVNLEQLGKIVVVKGDVSVVGLGMSERDR